MAKAFISFLGTSDYLDCHYALDDTPGKVVKYVQEDLIQRCCMDWSSEDEIRIFTTEEAVHKNWLDNGHIDRKTGDAITSTGLEKRLETLSFDAVLKRIDIPKGDSEDEIWEIFHHVYSNLNKGEEIIIDITHGFRSLPVLLMTLIGYSRLLKNISVTGIYYGAFEVLGPPDKVSKMNLKERIAPIFDLTSFEKIIEWTQATQSFVKNGVAKDLEILASQQINPVLRDSQGKDPAAKAMQQIVKGIENISRNILLNRGADILLYDYNRIKSQLQILQQDDIFIKPLIPLFSEIENKIDTFAREDINNGFRAVDWCVSHGMIQQAITMLQENMVTFLLDQVGRDWGVEKNRAIVSNTMKIVSQGITDWDTDSGIDKEQLKLIDGEQHKLIKELKDNPFVLKLYKSFETLRGIRNDVNHGGYNREENNMARSSSSIQIKFEKCYDKIKKILSWDSL